MSQAFWDARFWAADFVSDYYWEFELPSVTGTIAVTLDGDACAFTGNFSEDFIQGAIAVQLDDATAALAGTFDIVLPLEGYFHPNYWHRDFFDDRFWANVPGSEASGEIVVVFDDFAAAAVGGSSEAGFITGLIDAFTDDVVAHIEATQASFIDFDIDVSVGVNWTVIDQPLEDGAIIGVLEDFTSAFVGSAQVPGQINGLIAVTLEDGTWAAAGTVVNPGAFTGSIAAQLDDVAGLITANVFEPADFRGEVHVTLDDAVAAIAGTNVRPAFTGTIAAVLEDTVIENFSGVFVPAGAIVGTIAVGLDDVTAEIEGDYTAGDRTGTVAVEFDDTTAAMTGLFVPVGGRIGQAFAALEDVRAVMTGSYTNPVIAQPLTTPVTVRSIDWKTLTDQYNAGQPNLEEIEYEFSGGRVFRRTGT